MYNEKIENLIKAALADGVLTEKEKQILFKNAQAEGIDLDEFEMVLDARLVELEKAEKEKAAKSAPKSDKYGTVRKCPACGAIVGAFKGVCPECGFEFTEVDANLSSKKLYDALSKEHEIKKKQEIIETFPLPNAKADLLEFLTALKPRILDQNSEFADVYFKKYSECIEKAKVSFFGDKQLQPFIDDFNQFSNELKKKESNCQAQETLDKSNRNFNCLHYGNLFYFIFYFIFNKRRATQRGFRNAYLKQRNRKSKGCFARIRNAAI